VLSRPGAAAEERARAALALTRPDCIDPALGPVRRAALDDERREILDAVKEWDTTPITRSRLHARRAAVWASLAYEEARRGVPAAAAAQRALAELLGVRSADLGDDRHAEYQDALLRVGAIRWAAVTPAPEPGALKVSTASGSEPGQTCVALEAAKTPGAALVRRCTFGIVWLGSAQPFAEGRALVLAVQPLESWRELWVFHQRAGSWVVDVVSPGADNPDAGYVDYAGFAPGSRRLLIAREAKERGRYRRHFEELRLEDLALVRQASSPELLPDFGRWQDVTWRRDTLAMH
jgi:hypothetical protein